MDMCEESLCHPSELNKEQTTGIVSSSESGWAEVVDRFGPWMLAKKSLYNFSRFAGTPSAAKSVDLAVSSNHGRTSSSF